MAKVPEMSNYAKRMTLLSGRIFGEITRPYEYKTMKIQRLFQNTPIENKQMIQRYFPPHPMLHFLTKVLRNYGLFRDEHADFQEEMLRLKTLRGKGPPKRGEGKRAMLRKQGLAK